MYDCNTVYGDRTIARFIQRISTYRCYRMLRKPACSWRRV